jgi:3-deoxy-D-manno-octulosonic-acid transferase
MSFLLYQFTILFYGFFIRIASLFHYKARLWIQGRRNLLTEIEKAYTDNKQKVIWMHCASAGEFEQGRPVLEQLRKRHPEKKIVLTFFSPSGYELRKNYTGVDAVYYLPLDTRRNAKRFIKALSPELVIMVKYEFWLNYLFELRHCRIPVMLISALFRPNQIFFKPYGGIFLKALQAFRYIFVQDESSKELLAVKGLQNIIVAGDTRFDRVIAISESQQEIPFIKEFISNHFCIVAGSTWQGDETILLQVALSEKNNRWIIVPHEIDEQHIHQLTITWPGAVRYSQLEHHAANKAYQTLIIDNVGMLSALYRYAHVAYVGGGFNKGIHNTLEAAVYGVPVLFGPKYQKFKEAKELIACKAAFAVHTADDVIQWLNTFRNNESFKLQCAAQARKYVLSRKGATEKIMNYIDKEISLS